MVHSTKGLYHAHIRKRLHQKYEPYPHTNKWKRFIDRIIYPVSILGLVLTVPQVTKIWIGKNAAGVSLISWIAYLIGAVFWLIYGIMHKEKPLIFTYVLWIFMDILIIIGIILF